MTNRKSLDNRTQDKSVSSNKKFDKTTRQRFLRAVERTGNVKASAAHAGVGESTVYQYAKKNPEFKEALDNAKERCLHAVEQEIYRRGVEGWEEPVYYQGELIGHQPKFDSNLLIHLARTLAPERHAQKQQIQVEHSGQVEHRAHNKLADLLGVDSRKTLNQDGEVEDADFDEPDD